MRNKARRRGASATLDIRVQQAAAFLLRAAARLPNGKTRGVRKRISVRAAWRRITPALVCKRVGWKGNQVDFLRHFKKLHGHSFKQHMGGLWKDYRQRVKAKEWRTPTPPLTFQVGAGWFYYPGWLPPGTQPGDWITLKADGTAKKVDGPEMERKAV